MIDELEPSKFSDIPSVAGKFTGFHPHKIAVI